MSNPPSPALHRTVPIKESITKVGKGYPDKLVIFRLPASSYWWVRYWTQNKMVKKSTKTPRKNEALQFAKKFFEEILLRERNLLPVTKSPTFEKGIDISNDLMLGNPTNRLRINKTIIQ
jgi:hypothetical protein